jgi:hypothetical protein
VDLSLYKLTMTRLKHLKRVVLSGLPDISQELLMDVNKTGEGQDSFAWAQFTAT